MSRLNDLIRQVANADAQLAKDLQRETDALADRRAFGLNFERHTPEAVELPGRPVRKNDKVRILPDRGEPPKKEDERLFKATKIYAEDGVTWADVVAVDDPEEAWSVAVEDLVVVAEFRDPIYPGLVSTGKVERGGDKPFHTVINAENYHALQALLYTHRGKVDAIYIDPPYNSGARDWKYNNDYVEADDYYRHSKWLAMMERRLVLAQELLNPDGSVLIVTIDEKEYLRVGLLLEQTFPEAKIQMVSTIIKPEGTGRKNEFSRTNEYVYFAMFGDYKLVPTADDMVDNGSDEAPEPEETPVEWRNLRRRERESVRTARPNQFYPIYVDNGTGQIHSVGDALPYEVPRTSVSVPDGCTAYFPLTTDGTEMLWSIVPERMRFLAANGYARFNGRIMQFLNSGTVAAIERGEIEVRGIDKFGGVVAVYPVGQKVLMPKTAWSKASHNSQASGSLLLKSLVGDRTFPFPKSLYAVEDSLRFFVASKPEAVVLDFFSGSGTTAHAVMRLNRQDHGRRRAIAITNNEVGADEQRELRQKGLRPGEPDWDRWGICDYITKPRIAAAITGVTPTGDPVRGRYRFVDEFPMADGFEENVEFFSLTYESAMRVSSHREFPKIAPFLWLRAGSRGRRIDDISTGWDVADAYGVIANLDMSEPFIKAIEAEDGLTHAFIVTDEDRLFEAMVRQLPEHVEPVRLYSSYLRNFEIEAVRAAK